MTLDGLARGLKFCMNVSFYAWKRMTCQDIHEALVSLKSKRYHHLP